MKIKEVNFSEYTYKRVCIYEANQTFYPVVKEALLLENTSRIPAEYQRRLRLIPMRVFGTQRILFGIRPDDFFVCKNNKKEHVRVVLAYDKEDGDYEGYKVLIPSAIARNV